jgi:hypothetical protein
MRMLGNSPDNPDRVLAARGSFVIRCTGVSGAFGPAVPAGGYLVSFDPDAADLAVQSWGLAIWSASIGDALRFGSEAAAHECIEAGLTRVYKVAIVPVPASRPPVVTGEYALRIRGVPLTEAERREAQAVVDRLWLDGYL